MDGSWVARSDQRRARPDAGNTGTQKRRMRSAASHILAAIVRSPVKLSGARGRLKVAATRFSS
jgi:hypothetical protein